MTLTTLDPGAKVDPEIVHHVTGQMQPLGAAKPVGFLRFHHFLISYFLISRSWFYKYPSSGRGLCVLNVEFT